MRLLLALATLYWQVCCGAGYRYLVVFPTPSISHAILGRGVVGALTDQGHEVTHITAVPEKSLHELVAEVDVSFLLDQMKHVPNFFKAEPFTHNTFKEITLNLSRVLVSSEPVQRLLTDRSQHFDAVITEWFFNDIYTGFAQVFECPWMVLAPSGMFPMLEYEIEHVNSPAVEPLLITGYSVPMTFPQRVVNTFLVGASIFSTVFFDYPREEAVYLSAFAAGARARGATLAPYADALADASVMFSNSHPTLAPPLAAPRNLVDVAGYHIREDTAPLPKDLSALLDGATHGVLYFSMGSNLKSKDMPDEMRASLLAMFATLPLTVLWKLETELPQAPPNVHVRRWFPQSKILGHANVRVFVTHGGMLSGTEALAAATPLITIPVYGDQFANAQRAADRGYSLTVPLHEPDLPGRLRAAVYAVLNDTGFADRVRELSAMFLDRPIPPARLISFWAEHVVRTGGAKHMRSISLLVPWWQRWLLDVIGAILAVIVMLAAIVRGLYRRCCGKSASRNAAGKSGERKKKN